jgi:hypothetical protein
MRATVAAGHSGSAASAVGGSTAATGGDATDPLLSREQLERWLEGRVVAAARPVADLYVLL